MSEDIKKASKEEGKTKDTKRTMTLSLFTLCLLNATKEALYLLLAPFFPKQMELKEIPEKYYAPMFV